MLTYDNEGEYRIDLEEGGGGDLRLGMDMESEDWWVELLCPKAARLLEVRPRGVSRFSPFSLIFLLSSKRPNIRSNHDMALSYLILFILSFHTSKSHHQDEESR